MDIDAQRVDGYLLVDLRSQSHLDAVLGLVVAGDVVERGEIEVTSEVAIDHRQDVAVERGGDTGGVVVRCDQPLAILDQVGPHKERVTGDHRAGQLAEEPGPACAIEVADGATEERDHPPPARREVREVTLEVAHDGLDPYARILAPDAHGSLA